LQGEILLGAHQQRLAAQDILLIIDHQQRGPCSSADLLFDGVLTGLRQIQQVAIDAVALTSGDPLLIGLDGAALHAHGDHIALQPCQIDIQASDLHPPAPIIDQPIAQQRKDCADLEFAQSVGDAFAIIRGEWPHREAIAGIDRAAIAGERAGGFGLGTGAIIIAQSAPADIAVEDQIIEALGGKHTRIGLALAGHRFEDLRGIGG